MPRYARALRALHDTAINLLSDQMIESILGAVIAELGEDLDKQRERFGGEAYRPVDFHALDSSENKRSRARTRSGWKCFP